MSGAADVAGNQRVNGSVQLRCPVAGWTGGTCGRERVRSGARI